MPTLLLASSTLCRCYWLCRRYFWPSSGWCHFLPALLFADGISCRRYFWPTVLCVDAIFMPTPLLANTTSGWCYFLPALLSRMVLLAVTTFGRRNSVSITTNILRRLTCHYDSYATMANILPLVLICTGITFGHGNASARNAASGSSLMTTMRLTKWAWRFKSHCHVS